MWSHKPFTGSSLAGGELVLSFDDGPGPSTIDLANYLAEEGIRAAFFVVGKHVRQCPSSIRRLVELGHIVGNHSENHLRLTDSSVTDQQALAEFENTEAALAELGVPQPMFFRAPYGAWNPHLSHLFGGQPRICLNSVGPVNWDICGRDDRFWREGCSAEACAHSYVKAVEKGKRGIVLFHDSCADSWFEERNNRTFEMVRLLVPRLRDRGFSFRSLSDVPALRSAADLGLRCALNAMNGRFAEVDFSEPADTHYGLP